MNKPVYCPPCGYPQNALHRAKEMQGDSSRPGPQRALCPVGRKEGAQPQGLPGGSGDPGGRELQAQRHKGRKHYKHDRVTICTDYLVLFSLQLNHLVSLEEMTEKTQLWQN